MDKRSEIDGVTDRSVDASMADGHWWRTDVVFLLPGEVEGGVTVFETRFWDGCCYIGYTDTALTVFESVDDLVASPFAERQSTFVADHCARMGSVVRIVASGLDVGMAVELRDELVRGAPEGMRTIDAAGLEARECFLLEVPAEPLVMTFSEWLKTRPEGEPEGEY